jgi:hypothetical protein
MSPIFDYLFLKRYCLPYNIDISAYENGDHPNTFHICGNYNHICCVLHSSLKKANILCYGINIMGDADGLEPSIHAEHAALLKLKPRKNKKHLFGINLLVIRISKRNKLQNSKPCANCIYNMKTLPNQRGYKIKHIYYSNEHGDIVKSNLLRLEKEELYYTRFYRKKNKKNQK